LTLFYSQTFQACGAVPK